MPSMILPSGFLSFTANSDDIRPRTNGYHGRHLGTVLRYCYTCVLKFTTTILLLPRKRRVHSHSYAGMCGYIWPCSSMRPWLLLGEGRHLLLFYICSSGPTALSSTIPHHDETRLRLCNASWIKESSSFELFVTRICPLWPRLGVLCLLFSQRGLFWSTKWCSIPQHLAL